MEAVVAIFLVLILSALITSLITLRGVNQLTARRAQAAALADEQVNAVRRLDVTALPTQTSGPLRTVLFNAGGWRVVTDATQPAGHSVPNVVELPGNGTTAEAGRLLLPAGTYAAVTVSAKWLAVAGSPAGWSVGAWVHARDARNGYRVRVAAAGVDLDSSTAGVQNVLLEEVTDGTAARLASGVATSVTLGTWFTLGVDIDGSNAMTVTVNGTTAASATDTSWLTGPVALLGWAGVHAEVDDVVITTTSTDTWNFDAESVLPTAWTRLGVNDLPDTTATTFDDNATLTIEPYPDATTTTLKRVTVTVSWLANGATRTYTTTTFIGRSGLGQ